MKIIWQEDEAPKGPFLEETAAEEQAVETNEEEEQQPSAGQGFSWQ